MLEFTAIGRVLSTTINYYLKIVGLPLAIGLPGSSRGLKPSRVCPVAASGALLGGSLAAGQIERGIDQRDM